MVKFPWKCTNPTPKSDRAIEQELATRSLRQFSDDQLQKFASIMHARIQELYAEKKKRAQQANPVNGNPSQAANPDSRL
jgi:hypothetical protein